MDHPFCPHCGFNLEPDVPIEMGKWKLLPDMAAFDGWPLPLTRQEASFLHTLAKAAPRSVRVETIGERISDIEDPVGLARVIACKLRKKLPAAPFETKRYGEHGYVWKTT